MIKLMNLTHADTYPRRFPFLTKLTLPYGTIDLEINTPDQDVTMIGTKAMLVARDDLHPALINLLIDAAREIHGRQGYFEAAGEFPEPRRSTTSPSPPLRISTGVSDRAFRTTTCHSGSRPTPSGRSS